MRKVLVARSSEGLSRELKLASRALSSPWQHAVQFLSESVAVKGGVTKLKGSRGALVFELMCRLRGITYMGELIRSDMESFNLPGAWRRIVRLVEHDFSFPLV